MSKSKGKFKGKKSANSPTPAPPAPPPKKGKLGVGTIAGIIAIILFAFFLYDRYKAPRRKLEDSQFNDSLTAPVVVTTLHPEYRILETRPVLKDTPLSKKVKLVKGIRLDSATLNVSAVVEIGLVRFYFVNPTIFQNGIELNFPFDSLPKLPSGIEKVHLKLLVVNDRLYASATFIDLQTEETIGYLEWNHWVLYKTDRLDFKNDDERLEVYDNKHNIVFSINFAPHYTPDPIISFAGYFINSKAVVVVPNKDIDSARMKPAYYFPRTNANWKNEALDVIEDIQTIFPESNRPH